MSEPKQAPMSASLNVKQPAKEFNFYELLGLRKAFHAIEISNPKRTGNVDYWLNKNDKIVGDAFALYLEKEQELIYKYAEVFTHPELINKDKEQVKFIVYQGKDAEDTLLNDRSAFFKLSFENEKPVLDFVTNPKWDLEIPAEKEGEEPTVKKMNYQIKFVDEKSSAEFETKLSELQTSFTIPCELWKLKEASLEGLNVMWKGRDEDLSQFRNLIYEFAVSI